MLGRDKGSIVRVVAAWIEGHLGMVSASEIKYLKKG